MDSPLSGAALTETTIPAEALRVLVLQGGGALGSYQAGAYQALCHHEFDPKWLAGISIGAINAAIIAGNPRERRIARLKEFWEMVSSSSPIAFAPLLRDDHARSLFNEASAAMVATFGVPGFFKPRFPSTPFWPSSPHAVSYYDTSPLRETLLRLVDFDRLNDDGIRLSVGAVNIATGNFEYFDNTQRRIGPEHIMASAALPPGFPPIEIDGQFYWDGGIVSNTPLDYVLEQERNEDLLIFQVDLFSSRGSVPATLFEADEREKDIRYSSRTRMNTDMNRKIHNAKRAVRELIAKLPDDLKDDPLVAELTEAARENTVTVVHLIYRSKAHEASSKDYDFSRLAMTEHWSAGERDVYQSMRHPEWLERPQADDTMMAYDLSQEGSENIK
ncbi:MAG: patatin-like phospholipase family protein [Bradyrhizobiaceae bacterium]|nr:MAG: patatin-like phospholipase family protein [Bradyrhizobiaceae bacterium]